MQTDAFPGSFFDDIEKPPSNLCFVCKKGGEALPRCQKCRSVPYCSRECQTKDWKAHKLICVSYIQSNLGKDTTTVFGERGKKGKKGKQVRTRGEIMTDMSRYAYEHNGDSYTVACWHAMNLAHDLNKAQTHFLGVVLQRNLEAKTDRTLYTLVDAEVLPLTVLLKKFESVTILTPSGKEVPMTPVDMLKQDAARRMQDASDGALGSVMVVSAEFDENAAPKSVEQYIADTANPTFQPLGLFEVHRNTPLFRQMNTFFGSNWKLCLKNGLAGGRYSPTFMPYNGE